MKTIFLTGIILMCAPPSISLIKEQYHEYISPAHAVGVMSIHGPIASSEKIISDITTFFRNTNIKGIIIRIECDKGALGSAQMIFHEIATLKKEYPKPVVALIENSCTAEGYLVACAADALIASGAATIGGIKPPSEIPEKRAEDMYQQMITMIAHKRKISSKDYLTWADGQIFTGNQALKLHLIDKVGSISDAQNFIKEKMLLDGDVHLVCPKEKLNIVHFFKTVFV